VAKPSEQAQSFGLGAPMSDTFDPYREWLGVQDPQRPPNYYVLLGLDLFEHDREKIWNTSMGLMAAVLEHDPGPYCEDARRIFDELERARDCLYNPLEKQAYDARLRERRSATPAASGGRRKSWGALPAPARGSSVIQDDSASDSSFLIAESAGGSSIGRRTAIKPEDAPAQSAAAKRHWEIQHPRLAGAALGLLLLAGLIGYVALREPPEYDPVPALVAQLRSADSQQRIAAARALRKLGPRMSDALPQLVQMLAHEGDDDVRVAIAEAVREAGPGTVAYSRDFEIIKIRDTHPGVRQIMDELIAK
jgi:hypothetical protein